ANLLKQFADEFQACVVIVNQVTDEIEKPLTFEVSDAGQHNSQSDTDCIVYSNLFKQRKVKPALGLGWSNCINARIFLTRNVGTIERTTIDKKALINDKIIRIQSYNTDK